MRTQLHLVLLTACLFVLPSCIVSGPQMPCTFAVPAANTGGGGGDPAAVGVAVGSPVQLRVPTQDANGNPTAQRPTFASSDASVATVSPDGLITPVKVGTTTVTITDPSGTTRTVVVTVTPAPASGINVTPNSMTLTKFGPATVPLKVTGATAPTFVSGNSAVATVAPDGTVTAVSNGTATIIVTAGGQTAQVPITVAVAQAPSASATANPGDLSIHVTPGAMGIPVGATNQLKVRISDRSKNVVNVTPSYVSSDPAIARVDANGLVTGVSPGKTIVTISVAGDTRTIQVNVTKGGAMNVSPNSLTLHELGESGVSIKAKSAKGPVTYTSSTPSVVTVSSDGTVTAVSNGTAVITVSDGTTSEDVAITVDTTAAGKNSGNNGNNGDMEKSNNANTDNQGTNSEGGNPGLGDNGSMKSNFAADTCY